MLHVLYHIYDAMNQSSLISFICPVPALSEVLFEGGSAHATSEHTPPWTADKAFARNHGNAWINSLATNERIFPEIVWYEFPAGKTFVPGRVSFRPRQDGYYDQVPTHIGLRMYEIDAFNP